MQVPVGVFLDRYGPRRVVAALLCIAGLGALGFALAGSLAQGRKLPTTVGSLPTTGPLFTGLLVSIVIVISGLTYLPALALAPLAEGLA